MDTPPPPAAQSTKEKAEWLLDFAFKTFGAKPIQEVESADVLSLCQTIENLGKLDYKPITDAWRKYPKHHYQKEQREPIADSRYTKTSCKPESRVGKYGKIPRLRVAKAATFIDNNLLKLIISYTEEGLCSASNGSQRRVSRYQKSGI